MGTQFLLTFRIDKCEGKNLEAGLGAVVINLPHKTELTIRDKKKTPKDRFKYKIYIGVSCFVLNGFANFIIIRLYLFQVLLYR